MKKIPLTLLWLMVLFTRELPAQIARQIICIDGSKPGRTFEGIGALSAGASSRLLIDYPEPIRSCLLDLLFKPNFGASLHHLKVEIGGGINSTLGTEASHAYTRAEFNNPDQALFSRGYEWWVMKEAKKRNQNIYLDCLEWGAPAWIGNGNFFSSDNAAYICSYISGAKKYHGLSIDYTGIWNERPYDKDWIIALRKMLDSHQMQNVKIIAADQTFDPEWTIVEDMNGSFELAGAVYAAGNHYSFYKSTEAAKKCGKPLWSSEDGALSGDWYGACKLAKLFNRNYITGKMTKTIIWSLISSYLENLPFENSGLMIAREPWSGHFEIQPAIWITAHTTQFAKPGWNYIDSGCGYLESIGSYVTLKSPDSSGNYSIIIETTDASQVYSWPSEEEKVTIQVKLSEDMSPGTVYVWRSNHDEQFIQIDSMINHHRSFFITLEGESVYTLTTTTGQHKGEISSPASLPFPLPYRDNFEDYATSKMPRYFTDQSGAFEVEMRPEGKGQCLKQLVTEKGIEWSGDLLPYTVIGSGEWSDYEVSSDVLLKDSGFVYLIGRIEKILMDPPKCNGYCFSIDQDGNWEINAEEMTRILKKGKVPLLPGQWHNLKLRFSGDNLKAFVDGREVASINDITFGAGLAGIGCGWNNAYFDNFYVKKPDQPK